LNPGPPALDAKTLPLGYQGGGQCMGWCYEFCYSACLHLDIAHRTHKSICFCLLFISTKEWRIVYMDW